MSSTPIADMVEKMLAEAVTAPVIVLAVRTAEASRDASRSVMVPNRSPAAIRAARYRQNLKQKQGSAETNDAAEAGARTPNIERDASRDGVTACCDLSSLLSSESPSGTQEVREKKQTEIEAPAPKKVSRETRGTRMVAGARITDDELDFALSAGMSRDLALNTWAGFVDYWIGVPGQRGTKLDWSATWRNWVRRTANGNHRPTGVSGRPRGPAPQPTFREIAAKLRGTYETPATQPDPREAAGNGAIEGDFFADDVQRGRANS